jgi:hypothetical protein
VTGEEKNGSRTRVRVHFLRCHAGKLEGQALADAFNREFGAAAGAAEADNYMRMAVLEAGRRPPKFSWEQYVHMRAFCGKGRRLKATEAYREFAARFGLEMSFPTFMYYMERLGLADSFVRKGSGGRRPPDWRPEHDACLKALLKEGMTWRKVIEELRAKFGLEITMRQLKYRIERLSGRGGGE